MTVAYQGVIEKVEKVEAVKLKTVTSFGVAQRHLLFNGHCVSFVVECIYFCILYALRDNVS